MCQACANPCARRSPTLRAPESPRKGRVSPPPSSLRQPSPGQVGGAPRAFCFLKQAPALPGGWRARSPWTTLWETMLRAKPGAACLPRKIKTNPKLRGMTTAPFPIQISTLNVDKALQSGGKPRRPDLVRPSDPHTSRIWGHRGRSFPTSVAAVTPNLPNSTGGKGAGKGPKGVAIV